MEINVGVDFGGSHIAIGVVNKNGEIIEREEKYFTLEEKVNLKQISVDFLINSVQNLKNKFKFTKIGIGVAGTVSNGIIIKSVNLGIENFDIKQELENKLNIETIVKNDAKCASIAEYNLGNCNKYKNVLFLTIGTGIGGSYIYKGKLLEGTFFEGLEVGHMVIEKEGLKCKCGKNGCFEKYANLVDFKRKIVDKLGIPYNTPGEEIRKELENINEMEKIKDKKNNYVEYLALGLSNLINILEPDCIILGGGYARYSYLLTEDLKKKVLNSNYLFNTRKDIIIEPAVLQNDAGIIGASMLTI